MTKLLLTEKYPKEQDFGVTFIAFHTQVNILISKLYGDDITGIIRRVTEDTERSYAVVELFSNGAVIKTVFQDNPETCETIATAYGQPQSNYLSKLTDKDVDYVCSLAMKRRLELTGILEQSREILPHEQGELDRLGLLIPKLMIVTGGLTEANFGG